MNWQLARPSLRSVGRFESIWQSCPFAIQLNQIHLRLWQGEGTTPIAPGLGSSILVSLEPVKIWYNPVTQLAELSAKATGPMLMTRLTELGVEYDDTIRVVFMSHAPALSRAAKPFIASVGDSVVNESKMLPFSFDPDYFMSDSG